MYQIITATEKHTEEIIQLWTKLMAIHKELDADYFSETDNTVGEYKSDIEWHIKDDSNVIYIAIVDDVVVGYITAQLIFFSNSHYNLNSNCTVGDIMIDTNYQHLGIGKAFIEEIKKWSKLNSISKINLNVFSKNKRALSFFKNQGFDDQFNNLILEF